MSARSERFSPAVGTLILLTLGVLIALKLAHVTGWSWWWVLSPLWIAAAAGVIAFGGMVVFFALVGLQAWLRLRLRFRQVFPEVFIDPARWSRVPADPAEDS